MTFCNTMATWAIIQRLQNENKELITSLRRLTAAVRQAGDFSAWPVCGEGDAVGDELVAALVEAEKLIGGQ